MEIESLRLIPKYLVEMVEKWKAHFYTVDNHQTFHPGATTVLGVIAKPGLIFWYVQKAVFKIQQYLIEHAQNRMLNQEEIIALIEAGQKEPEAIKEAAADLGTRAHKAIDE